MAFHYESFQTYIERQQPPQQRQTIFHFTDYAYVEDMQRIRSMYKHRVVREAALGLGKIWSLSARRQFMNQCDEVEERSPFYANWMQVATTLHIARPRLYTRKMDEPLWIVQSPQETFVVLSQKLLDLPQAHLTFWMGAALGGYANGHALAMTLAQLAGQGLAGKLFSLWFKRMSKHSLQWELIAHITRDRAGLIASQNLIIATESLVSGAAGWRIADTRKELERQQNHLDVDWEDDILDKRVKALSHFAQSQIYRERIGKRGGNTMRDVDEAVANLLNGT